MAVNITVTDEKDGKLTGKANGKQKFLNSKASTGCTW